MNGKLVKGRVFGVVGDIHIDDKFRGSHINYRSECYQTLRICKEFGETEKLDIFASTGDIFGVRSNVSKIEDRVLLKDTAKTFESVAPHVVLNQGNHDMFGGQESNDYYLLNQLGYYDIPESLEKNFGQSLVVMDTGLINEDNDKPLKIAFHFIAFGKDNDKIELVEDAVNVAITHGDFYANGSMLSRTPESIPLESHEPFVGLDLVVNGHIHIPTQVEVVYQDSGDQLHFANIGSVARVNKTENHSFAIGIVVKAVETKDGYGTVVIEEKLFELSDPNEVFISRSETMVKEIATDAKKERELDDLLDSVRVFEWSGESLNEKISKLPVEKKLKEMMLYYARKAE